MVGVSYSQESAIMPENKADKPLRADAEKISRHNKRAEERRQRQSEALRANLKKRKTQVRERENPDGEGTS